MNFTKYILKVLILLLTLFAGRSIANACLCDFESMSFRKSFDSYNAVFIGQPITDGKKKWKVEVSKVYKGNIEELIYIDDALADSSCASRFNKGQEYLFFVGASKDGSKNIPMRRNKLQVFYAGACSMTTAMSDFEKPPMNKYKETIWQIFGEGNSPIKREKL